MNDAQLESLLLAAGKAAGAPTHASPELADRARQAHARRRQRTGRVKLAFALVGCYFAGMGTMWTAFPLAETGKGNLANDSPRPNTQAKLDADALALALRQHEAPKKDTQGHLPTQPPSVVERSRYELLRQMGDERYRRGDLQTAIAFYAKALDVAPEDEQKISYEQDNWLLISLKKDHLASQHARTHGDSI